MFNMGSQTAQMPLTPALIIERISPINGEVVSREAAQDRAESLRLATRAAAAFPAWSSRPAGERAQFLLRIAERLEHRAADLGQAMLEEIGAPQDWIRQNQMFACQILRDVAGYAEEVERVESVQDSPDRNSRVERAACGVCLGIAPWNAPLILGVRAIAAPLLCGNTVLLKGSEFAPRVFRLLGEVLQEAGLPDGVAQVVLTRAEDSEEVVDALIASPVVRRVNFTGSTRVGRRVAEICAKYLKRPLLELGGQSAMIVLSDADLDLATQAALQGAYRNQGQICMSTERLIVASSVADELIARIEAGRRALLHGDPRSPGTEVGPVISREAAERLTGMIRDAVQKGAHLVGGGRMRDAYLEPALLDRVEPDMRLYQEEVFGPVLAVTRVGSDLEALSVANDSEYGLACAVFSQDARRAETLARQLHSGICHINSGTIHDSPHAPFGGVKSSGYGRFGGRWALQEFTELRWITSPSAE
jgi:benzaldehyde dehydrogenase (NAD)